MFIKISIFLIKYRNFIVCIRNKLKSDRFKLYIIVTLLFNNAVHILYRYIIVFFINNWPNNSYMIKIVYKWGVLFIIYTNENVRLYSCENWFVTEI